MQSLFRKLQQIMEQLYSKYSPPSRMDYIGGADMLPPPLSKEEEDQVFADLLKGNPQARDTLIVRNLRRDLLSGEKNQAGNLRFPMY